MTASRVPQTGRRPGRADRAAATPLVAAALAAALAMPGHGAAQSATVAGTAPSATGAQAAPLAGLPAPGLRMAAHVRAEAEAALGAMSDQELTLTYARIHAAFRAYLGHDDLSVARALIDYAALAQIELSRRNLARPPGTESVAGMGIAYELIL